MNRFNSLFRKWVPFAITITLICGIIYFVTQQVYRHTANDPQEQMAEDAVASLEKGINPKTLVPDSLYEFYGTLSPYLIIYDEKGNGIASEVMLNGKIPKLPAGVFEYVRKNGEDKISWQPARNIRQAIVVKSTKSGKLYFVMAGRSLRKTEERVNTLSKLVLFAWAGSLIILFAALWIFNFIIKPE